MGVLPGWGAAQAKKRLIGLGIAAIIVAVGIVAWYFATRTGVLPDTGEVAGGVQQASVALPEPAFKSVPIDLSKARPYADTWKKSDEVFLAHRSELPADVFPPPRKPRENTKNLSGDDETETITASEELPAVAAYSVSLPPPKIRQQRTEPWAPKPIPVAEITDKRERLARGEQIYKRVIVKRPASYYAGKNNEP